MCQILALGHLYRLLSKNLELRLPVEITMSGWESANIFSDFDSQREKIEYAANIDKASNWQIISIIFESECKPKVLMSV